MATVLSNHWLSFAGVPSPTGRPSGVRAIPSTSSSYMPRNFGTSIRFQRFSVLSVSSFARRPLRSSLRVAVSDPKTVDGEEDDQLDKNSGEAKTVALLPMKDLIQSYKEAILNGDEMGITDIESAICSIEREKNDLVNKTKEITRDIASGREMFLRLTADFENFRKRIEKDRLKFSSDIQAEVIESLLPMVDGFEKNQQQMKPETEKEKKIDSSYQGIYKQFVETLRASRVAVIDTVGQKFDPSVHEAVARVESEQFREGTIAQEVRRGFVLGDRVLRPAIVKVSSGSGVKDATPAVEKSVEGSPVAKQEEASLSASREQLST